MKKMVRSLAVAFSAALVLGMAGCNPTVNVTGHVHKYSDKWSKAEENHWHDCECGARKDEAAHTFGAWNDGKKSCTTCGYEEVCQHTVGEWISDTTHHWKECGVCGKNVEESAHSFVHKGNCWQACSCGKQKAVSLETLGTYNSTKMTFGVYPQTIKAGTVTVDKTVKNTEITGADYYLGSDGAWYAECVENGYATGSSSSDSQYKYSNGSYVAQYNSSTPKTLYFKVEPIEWTKLSTTKCLVASKILTAGIKWADSSNNYENSNIRSWLNGSFYNSAFTSNQQEKIKTTSVDNSVASTGYSSNSYACGNTSDKVFLLSYKEAFSDNELSNSDRIRKPTDYAFANYCYKHSDSSYGGWWWLRSPDNGHSDYARVVIGDGSDDGSDAVDYVSDALDGVVPALSISEGN